MGYYISVPDDGNHHAVDRKAGVVTGIPDHYDLYYADKLWKLLPTVFRAQDTDDFNANGPLREMVNRLGAQAAILRRGIDRLWDDQSIETCDDWIIPYIGALLDVNLVSGLDARGQRLDVAKTIYYRRRKGTVAILEEIASDITGWDAKVVEFFRRLGRTRHGLDPPIGLASSGPDVASLQLAEGLIGGLTGPASAGSRICARFTARPKHTRRSTSSSTPLTSARPGKCRLVRNSATGVFLWRLPASRYPKTTPVESTKCPGQFTFDPTGREIPLYAVSVTSFGDAWTSPAEWQLPTPITPSLLEPVLAQDPAYPLYSVNDPNDNSVTSNALGVLRATYGEFKLIPACDFTTDPANLLTASFSAPAASAPRPSFLIDPARPAQGRRLDGSRPATGDVRLRVLLDDRRGAL